MGGKYFTGIIFILLGAGLLLDKFAILEFGKIISNYWPSIIILLGLTGLIDRKSSKKSSLVVLTAGILLQIQKLGLIEFNVFSLILPIILIYIGLNIIFSKKGNNMSFYINNGNMNFSNNKKEQ